MKIKITVVISLLVFGVFLGVFGIENYLVLLALAIMSTTNNIIKYIRRNYLLIILLLHAVIYYINYSSISLDWLAKNMFNPVILFVIGYWLTVKQKSNELASKILILGLFMHGALNVGIYIQNPLSMMNREFVNIWGGTITATLHNILFIPIVCLLFYTVYIEKNKMLKSFILIGIIIAIYSTIVSASRTLIFMLVIGFLLNIFLNKRDNKKKINTLISICLIITTLIILYQFNVMGIRSWLGTSNLGERLAGGISNNDSIVKNIRWEMSLKILRALPTHPFGKITVVHYAHNLFLDIAKYTGILSATGLTIWSINSMYKYAKYVLKTRKDWDIVLFSIGVCMTLVLLLEPVLEGLPIIFSSYCYLCGIYKGSQVIYNKRK